MGVFSNVRGPKLSAMIAVVAGMDFCLFGFDQGVTGGLLTLPSFRKTFPEIDTIDHPLSSASHASVIQGITVASYTLGCLVGAIATIWLGNFLGRRRTVIWGTIIILVGATIQTSSFGLTQFIVGRVITGLGTGMNTSTVPTWQSETAKPHHRGRMVAIETTLIVFGVMLANYVDLGLSFTEPSSVSWTDQHLGRFPIAFQIIMCIFILTFAPALPESPRWLALKGRGSEALSVIAALWDLPEDNPRVQDEFSAIVAAQQMAQTGFKACFEFNRDRNFHRTLLGYLGQVAQQLTGINVVAYYATTIYQTSIGLSPLLSHVLAAASATQYFLVNCMSIFFIEKTGRRQLLIWSAIGQSVTMAALAGLTSTQSTEMGIAATVFVFLYCSSFALGWGNIPWLYAAEITPLGIRAPANAISTTGNWLFNFLIVMVTPPAFNSIKNYTYVIFAVINALLVPLIFFFWPETRYRSLEEIDEIFHEVDGIRGLLDVVEVANKLPRRYGKDGELLVPLEEVRRVSIVQQHDHKMAIETESKAVETIEYREAIDV